MTAVVTPLRSDRRAAPEWLSPEQVCELLPGMTPHRLQYLRSEGRGPRYYKPTAKTVIYERADVDAWISANAVATRGGL